MRKITDYKVTSRALEATASPVAVCTLCEGEHHFGVAALTNSLYRNGFRGTLYVGYRGNPPPWTRASATGARPHTFEFAPGANLSLIKVDISWHLANYKSHFMAFLFETYAASSEALVYFDPDIVVRCDWHFFERWLSFGVALCEENIIHQITADHPIRHIWAEFARTVGYDILRLSSRYYNSGFVGVPRLHKGFLSVWCKLQENLAKTGFDLSTFGPGNRLDAFHGGDQDTLNLAVMLTNCTLSTIGPEGMDFTYGGFCMSHATGKPKPWKKSFLLSSLKGKPASAADHMYLQYADGPITAHSKSWLVYKRVFDLSLSRILGKLIK